MNLFTLGRQQAHVIPFPPPIEGVARVKVTADKAINIYVLDEAGRARYETRDGALQPLRESPNSQTHDFVVQVAGPWFLVLENPRSDDVRGVYAVAAPFRSPTGMSGGGLAMGGGVLGYSGSRRGSGIF